MSEHNFAPDDLLVETATAAFRMGLEDARVRRKPDDALGLSVRLSSFRANYDWLNIHRAKFRQVYGAAFDMAATHARVEAAQNA